MGPLSHLKLPELLSDLRHTKNVIVEEWRSLLDFGGKKGNERRRKTVIKNQVPRMEKEWA